MTARHPYAAPIRIATAAQILADLKGGRLNPPTAGRPTCGKPHGPKAHYADGESACVACADARRAWRNAAYAARHPGTKPDGDPMPTDPQPRFAPDRTRPQPDPPAGPGPETDPEPAPATVEVLLDTASTSSLKRTRDIAARIRAQLDDLRTRVAEETRTGVYEQRIATLRAELNVAESALRRLRGGRPGPSARPPVAHDPKVVRAWARDHNVPCPPTGRVPGGVVDAYNARGVA